MEYQIAFGSIELVSKYINQRRSVHNAVANFLFNFTVGISAQPETKTAIVSTEIAIIEDEAECAKFHTLMLFELPEFEKVFQLVDEKRYDVPIDIEILLKSVAISTTRGIIFSEVRGTYLHNVVLPLIDIPGIVRRERQQKEKDANL